MPAGWTLCGGWPAPRPEPGLSPATGQPHNPGPVAQAITCNDASRAFAQKYKERTGAMPSMVQAATYSAARQYLKAIEAAGTGVSPDFSRLASPSPSGEASSTS